MASEARTRELLVAAELEPQRRAFGEEIEQRLEPYAEDGGYRLPGMCLNVLAT